MNAHDALDGLEIRRATHADDPQVLDLMRDTHGWRPEEPNESLFRWKHRDNPLGESPAWVALDGDRVVGYRTFMRWEFLDDDNRVVTAVRAVDTATAQDYRGRGIFRALTLQAVGELTIEGVGIIFNTPNDQSRPGYLKMGWTEVGRIPIGALPSGPAGVRRMATARVPAERWSIPTDVGLDAASALADPVLAQALLQHSPERGFRTRRTSEYLLWRTSLDLLHYRLMLVDSRHPSRGGIIFRLRRRGGALEAVVIESFVDGRRTILTAGRRLLRETGADYGLAIRAGSAAPLVPLPGQGPILTSRSLSATPPRPSWQLSMADVELM
jgi:GNAT superfamily N-acetyltransferase